jgi:hypothetical protein
MLFAVGSLALLLGSKAHAENAWTPGTACTAMYGSTLPVDIDDYGAGNLSTTSGQMTLCPFNIGGSYAAGAANTWLVNVSSDWLYYTDVTATSEVVCYTFRTRWDGAQWWGATKHSCATGGGCSTASNSYVGTNYLSWATTELPQGVGEQYAAGDNEGIVCLMPPATNTGWTGRSWIIGYDMLMSYKTV